MYYVNAKFDGPYSVKATVEPTNYSQVVGKTYVCEQDAKTINHVDGLRHPVLESNLFKNNKK